MPYRTPNRFTSTIQRQPRSSGRSTGVNDTTPALLTSTLAPPSSSSTRSDSATTDVPLRDVHLDGDSAAAGSLDLLGHRLGLAQPIVGDDHGHPLTREALGHRAVRARWPIR